MGIKRVTTRAIDDQQITTDKIADGAVALVKIAENAVGSAKIADGAVTGAKIASESVATTNIASGAVTGAKLAADAVTETNIATGAVTTAKLASSAATTAKIADASITAAKLSGAQSGSAPIYGARAWVNFNGTGTVSIRGSGNVSSITDGGTGIYSVNFTFEMPDTNYSVTVTARRIDANNANFSAVLKGTTSANTNYPLSTTKCEVICGTPSNNAFVDSDVVCVSVFR
jgi:hypothetical protein